MAKYSMFVYTRPVPGKEKEFMDWYLNRHSPDMCRIPGVVGCHLYKVRDDQFLLGAAHVEYPYVNNMEMETDDMNTLLMEMGKRRMSGENAWTDAIEEGPCYIMDPITG